MCIGKHIAPNERDRDHPSRFWDEGVDLVLFYQKSE
jgi:hypothetical protein